MVGRPARAVMTEDPDSTLDALVARLGEGDRSAFKEVFERLWPRTLRLCAAVLHNDADAADAAQQAMTKILERAAQYDRSRPALPWALAIASWECRTIIRKRGRRREVAAGELGEATSADGPGGDEAQVRRQLLEAAVTAMDTLSELDREALQATFWEEAASVSGATLRKRRERALTRLREAFRRIYGLD